MGVFPGVPVDPWGAGESLGCCGVSGVLLGPSGSLGCQWGPWGASGSLGCAVGCQWIFGVLVASVECQWIPGVLWGPWSAVGSQWVPGEPVDP